MKKQVVVVIGGPTASGKTDLAIQLAQALRTEIINADSRQIYQELSIGTAKPGGAQLAAVKHHMVDCRSITSPMNAGSFAEMAGPILEEILLKNNVAIISGGTGLYIQALLQGLDPLPPTPDTVRANVEAIYHTQGLEGIKNALLERSPDAGDYVALDNPARVRRAMELVLSSSQNLKELWTGNKKTQPFEVLGYYLDLPRKILYDRINLRCEKMLETGLKSEVQSLMHARDNRVLQSVGYSEFFDYFDGKYSLAECLQKIQQHTRNYAKRQVTWFKNKSQFQPVSPDKALETIFEALKPYGYSHNQ